MRIARRDLLALAMLRAVSLRAQSRLSPKAASDLFEIRRVSPRVWIALARPWAMLNCNAVIFELAESLLVVDTHSKPSAAAALAGQLRRTAPKPVRYVVNTHFHYDHAHGNAAWRPATILASAETRRLLAERGDRFAAESIGNMKQLARMARQKAADSEWWRQTAEQAEAYAAEMRDFRVDLPDVTFDQSLVLHDRFQEVHLSFFGRAHTASDTCVWSPGQKVVATGDLLVGFLPGMGDGYPAEWPATLKRLGELPFAFVAPGHGEPQSGRSRLDQMRGYIEELLDRVGAARREGLTLAETQQRVTASQLRSLQGPWGSYVLEMTRRWRPLPPGSDGTQLLADALRGNVAAVYERT